MDTPCATFIAYRTLFVPLKSSTLPFSGLGGALVVVVEIDGVPVMFVAFVLAVVFVVLMPSPRPLKLELRVLPFEKRPKPDPFELVVPFLGLGARTNVPLGRVPLRPPSTLPFPLPTLCRQLRILSLPAPLWLVCGLPLREERLVRTLEERFSTLR